MVTPNFRGIAAARLQIFTICCPGLIGSHANCIRKAKQREVCKHKLRGYGTQRTTASCKRNVP
jgi:hypothetical protein